MKVFLYQSALHCENCGNGIRQYLTGEGRRPSNPDDESGYGSDEFPKGPYGDGGGEADTPHHCDTCGLFLDNPLTQDGSNYVKSAWRMFVEEGRGNHDVLATWREGYPCEWTEFHETTESEVEQNEHTDLAVRRFNDLAERLAP